MATFISHSAQETADFGASWASRVGAGWLIGLTGDLGAGKTHWVRGLARGLGTDSRAHSPTFALLHEYRGGRVPLVHLDFYRLTGPAEIAAAGLEEYLLHPVGVTVVEWIERWLGKADSLSPAPRLSQTWVHFRIDILDQESRRFTYEDPGP
jgi:tRNA threonylcarbamoyladenosine biosynthesis protein TsaE